MIETKRTLRKIFASFSLGAIVCLAVCSDWSVLVLGLACGQESLPSGLFQIPEPVSQFSQLEVVPVPPMALVDGNRVQLQGNQDQVTLVTRDAPLSTVLSMIAQQ